MRNAIALDGAEKGKTDGTQEPLLGKADARIDAEDVGWAMRVAVLHLTDARRLLDGYNLSKLEAVIVKAEVFQAKIGHRPSKRELISGVRDIQNEQRHGGVRSGSHDTAAGSQ